MAKKFAMILGWVIVAIGVLGFINNPLIGRGPGAIFISDTAANLVHLVAGLALLWVAYMSFEKISATLKIVGGIYLLMALMGFFAPSALSDLMLVNGADNWLHLILAALLIWGGMSKSSPPSAGLPMGTM